MNARNVWLAVPLALFWAAILSTQQRTYWWSLAGVVFATLVFSVIIWGLYRLSGSKPTYTAVLLAVSIGIGALVLEFVIRGSFEGFVSTQLYGSFFFIKRRVILAVLEILLATIMVLVVAACIVWPDWRKTLTVSRRFLILAIMVLVAGEIVVLGSQTRWSSRASQSNISATIDGQRLFENSEIMDKCNFASCAGIVRCQVVESYTQCVYVVDILLNTSAQSRYAQLRTKLLKEGKDTATVSFFADDQETSRVTLNLSQMQVLPRVLQFAGEGVGGTAGQAEQNATNAMQSIIGAS